jgi:pyruvate ferredoxin oxidoreductase delta subunit
MLKLKTGGFVEPGSTEVTKTGAWRTFVPVINHKKCIKCSLCEIYCPESCIHQVDSEDRETLARFGHSWSPEGSAQKADILFVPDLEYCKGCGICAHECPRKVIEMVLEEK